MQDFTSRDDNKMAMTRCSIEEVVSCNDEFIHPSNGCDNDSSSSHESVETYLASNRSPLLEYSSESNGVLGTRKSHDSIRSDNRRTMKNVLMKRYSKLAYSVQRVREGKIKK